VVVTVDGSPLPSPEPDALAGVRVQQRLSLPDLCELTFRDPPGPLAGADRLAPGAQLRVTVAGHDVALFAGQVTAYQHVYGPSGAHEVRVRAYDGLHQLRKTQTVRAHVQVRLPALAEEFVAPLGLSVQAAADGPTWDRFIQHRRSDLEVLQELADRAGLYFHLREQVLHVFSLDGIGAPVELSLGQSLREVTVDVTGEPACRSVTASAWDPLGVVTITADVSQPRSGRTASASVSPAAVNGDGIVSLSDEVAQTDEQITALAQAELDRRLAREVTLWGLADGDPRLRPGSRVRAVNVDGPVAGEYVLTSVDHTIDDRIGFASEISTTPPSPRPRSAAAVATIAAVSRVDDPDGLGRVRVSLPAVGDVETEWMQVVSVGAGSGKGLVSTPDVGDQVLVLLAHGDPAQGVVLGGLFGAGGAPDPGVEGGAVRRHTWITAGGHRIGLDDSTHSIRVENAGGSYVELLPERLVVHAAGDLTLEAPGRTVRIAGMAVDFQQA
ncbi:MAG: phage baseplate assembly protein V, partial [Actinomycetota bacterium]|nr:phage baseplate assembly protein V [Actinomycetota bacterium]